MPVFGPAGNPQAFYDAGFKASFQMPAWLAAQGLFAYEYQCGRGVNIGEETARALGAAALSAGVQLSLHAPYYINLASEDPAKQKNSERYLIESLTAAQFMGARRVVMHPGSALSTGGRPAALQMAADLLRAVINQADHAHLLDTCSICPEVMGKMNQLGDLDEIMTLCQLDDRLMPCIDFGHLNARTQGGLRTAENFMNVCRTIQKALGEERLRFMHVHFSRISFSAGGEKQHHRLEDRQYGPDFEPFARVMHELDLDPVIICESDGTQADDAALMKKIYEES
jgi:deoxyribonuclease IV